MNLKPKGMTVWHELFNKKIVAIYISLALVLVINQVVFSVLLKNREMAKASTSPVYTLKVQQLTGGNDKIMVEFDQGVYTDYDSSGALNNVDPDMVEGGGTDGLLISAIDHIAGTNVAILTMNANLAVSLPGEVLISCNTPDQVYNSSNQQCLQVGTDVNSATTDLTAPELSSWDLDMNIGTLALNFSEPMDFTFDFDETQLIVEDATATNTYTLIDSIGSWTAPDIFTVTLSPTDINYLKSVSGLAENDSNLTINDITGLRDAVENVMVAGVASFPVNSYIPDTTLPIVNADNLVSDFSGCTGPGGVCNLGESITFTWDNSAGGDNPTGYYGDIASVTTDLSHFSGSASQALYDDGTNGDLVAGDGIWTYALIVTGGNYSNTLFYIIASDYAGNVNIPQCGYERACSCGNMVIADYTMTADLDCSGTGGDGFIIGKTGITIDGNNHTITGTYGSPVTILPYMQAGIKNIWYQEPVGYSYTIGYSNITIKNLIIKDFFAGILSGSAGVPLANFTIQDSSVINTTKYDITFIFPVGITIANSNTNVISGTTVTGYATGMVMALTTNNNISSNIFSANTHGLDIASSSTDTSTISDNVFKLSNGTALKLGQVSVGEVVAVSGNTFLFNRIDIEPATDSVGVDYNYVNDSISHNIDNRMIYFSAEPVTNLQLGVDTANFVFEIRDAAGRQCPTCVYTVQTSPGEIVTELLDPILSTVTGSFTPTKYGIYTLQITVTDSAGNIGKRNIPFYVYDASFPLATKDTTYYFRPGVDATHGQSKGGDDGTFLLTPPTATETENCSQWVINFIDELPDYPFGTMIGQDINFTGKSELQSNAYIFRFWNGGGDYRQDNTITQGSTYHPISVNFSALDWKMDYPFSWYHPVFEYGRPFVAENYPYLQTTPADPGTNVITHTYTTTPAIKYYSESDVLLLAANPATNPVHSTLILDGTEAIDQAVNVTLDNYKYPFSTEITRIDSDGTATLRASNVTAVTTFNSVNMALTPDSGYVDVDIDTWQLAGDFYKKWTETASNPLITTNHTVGDLLPGTLYFVKVNGTAIRTLNSTGLGEINFDYNGYGGLMTFEVVKYVAPAGSLPHVDSPGVVTNLGVKADSTGRVTITWQDPTDADLKEIAITDTSANGQTQTIVIAGGKESVVLTGRTVGSEYIYFIRAVDTSGLASPGVTITITIPQQGETQSGGSVLPAPEETLTLPDGVNVGDLIKVSNSTTVYFVDTDKRRHTFPNETTYFSYFSSFNGIKTIPLSTMAQVVLGQNVTVRPGTWLVKIQTDPKVYAVEPFGVLRSIPSQAVAAALYGANWSAIIADISPAFFVDYQVGLAVATNVHPTGTAFSYQGDNKVYYIDQGKKRYISTEAFLGDSFRNKFIIRNVSTLIAYENGSDFPVMSIEQVIDIR